MHAAFVTGVPDPQRDEVLAAVIVPEAGRDAVGGGRLHVCRTALAAYKVPRLVRFVAEHELPLTTTGKLQKNRLAATFFADRSADALDFLSRPSRWLGERVLHRARQPVLRNRSSRPAAGCR